jgi:hypothetical protein
MTLMTSRSTLKLGTPWKRDTLWLAPLASQFSPLNVKSIVLLCYLLVSQNKDKTEPNEPLCSRLLKSNRKGYILE